MLNPFLLTALFFLFAAILAALDAAFTSFTLLPWFAGMPWLRVHFITLGVATEVAFGLLPPLLAARNSRPAPATNWPAYLLLNTGLLLLVGGIPSINGVLINTGGTLIFLAVLVLLFELWQLQPRAGERAPGRQRTTGSGRFYAMALSFLLLGIIIGSGLWFGWLAVLQIGVPKEAHIHANSWGFASLLFAGLLIDLSPQLAGRPLASERTLRFIFWAMSIGAAGLVAGPWLSGALWVLVPGLVLHIAATVTLLVSLARATRAGQLLTTAGAWHLLLSYIWILLPVLVAPLILLNVAGVPGADVEATAPQALVYGWMLQFSYAVVPWALQRWLQPNEPAMLGGSWLSLILVNGGSLLIWVAIFLEPSRALLNGVAYLLLTVSLLAVAWPTGVAVATAVRRWEERMVAQ